MSDNFEPRDELTERLSALGSAPVNPALQSEHLTALAGVVRGASWRSMLASRVKLGAAVLGGFLIGTTGLASAGAMGPLQPIAKTTVEAVTPFEVPKGKSAEAKQNKGQAKKAEKAAKPGDGEPKAGKNWAGCNGDYSHQNRGQYLQSAKAASADEFKIAREGDCGKGLNADGTVNDDPAEDETKNPKDDAAKDQGKSEGKRQDDTPGGKPEGERGGKSGITEAPGKAEGDATPAEPTPAEDKPATPETPDAADAADDAPNSDNAAPAAGEAGPTNP